MHHEIVDVSGFGPGNFIEMLKLGSYWWGPKYAGVTGMVNKMSQLFGSFSGLFFTCGVGVTGPLMLRALRHENGIDIYLCTWQSIVYEKLYI